MEGLHEKGEAVDTELSVLLKGTDEEKLNNLGRCYTTAFRYLRNGWYYIALDVKGFSKFVCEWMGAPSYFYVVRAKALNGNFNLFSAADHFDSAQDSDGEDTPEATRNVFDDNMEALASEVFDGSDNNYDNQDPFEGEFNDAYWCTCTS